MGLPAARVGDPAGHGGVILPPCAPKVLIGGMPAARMGDKIACPGFDGPKPHVMGNITTASKTVMIYGAYAARQTDLTGCGIAGISGMGMPPTTGPPGSFDKQGALKGDKDAGIGWGQHSGYDNPDGMQNAGKVSGIHLAGNQDLQGGGSVSTSVDGITGGGEYHSGQGAAGASAQVSGVTAQAKYTSGQGSGIGAQGGILNAGAGIDVLEGTDGRRTGVALGVAAQASVAEAQADGVVAVPIPYTDYSINLGGTLGASAGSVGGAAALGAYHDNVDDRVHFMGLLDIEAILGAKIGFDISFGKRKGSSGGTPGIGIPMTPGTIIMGCQTVLIG